MNKHTQSQGKEKEQFQYLNVYLRNETELINIGCIYTRPRVLFIEFYTLTAKNNHVQNMCTLKNITNNKKYSTKPSD